MRRLIRLILTIGILFFLIRCEKEKAESRDWPRLHTSDVTNITSNGALFSAEFIYRGDFEILDYGFVWSINLHPTLENSYKVVYSDNINSKGFSAEIRTALEEGKNYYVRSFIRTMEYTVYGKDVAFFSLGSEGPTVNSFFPLTGTWGDTIMLHGKNFSYRDTSNIVKFGEIKTTVIDACDSVLAVVVPSEKNTTPVKVSVSISGNKSDAPESFSYLMPELLSIAPLTGTFNDTIIISGKNFGHYVKNCTVFFSQAKANIISFNNTQIKVTLPPEVDSRESTIKVTDVGFQLTYSNSFILNIPVIETIEPDTVLRYDQVITVNGKNFNPVPRNNVIQIGGYDVNIIESTGKYVKFYLPEQIIPYPEISVFKAEELNIQVAGQTNIESNNLIVNWKSTWTKRNDFPGRARSRAVAFSIGDKGYFGTGVTTTPLELADFWEYDPATDKWVRIQDLPGNRRAGAVSFSIGDKGYVGLGSEHFNSDNTNLLKDFYSYDPVSSSWTYIGDFPGIGRHSAAIFVIDGEGYLGTGWWGIDDPLKKYDSANDFWKYIPSTNTWIQQSNFNNHTRIAAGFAINKAGYLFDYDALYKFEDNHWTKINTDKLQTYENIAFSLNGQGYFGLGGGSGYLVDYNPVTMVSNQSLISIEELVSLSSVFVIRDKAFIVTSNQDVWEFDPSKPDL
jgi:hypothetical protein